MLLAFCCFPTFAANMQTSPSTGAVRGTLFLLGSDGPAYIPGGTVVLTGLQTQKTEADQEGRQSFEAVPPGTYRIEAVVSGVRADRSFVVEPGKITKADLELKARRIEEHRERNGECERWQGVRPLRDDFRANTPRCS